MAAPGQLTVLWLMIVVCGAYAGHKLLDKDSERLVIDHVVSIVDMKYEKRLEQQDELILELQTEIEHLQVIKREEVAGRTEKLYEQRLEEMTAMIEDLKVEINLMKGKCCSEPQNLNSLVDNPIAFTAGLSADFSGGSNNAIIPYDLVYLNHGEAYSTATYHFIAPVRGIYWFTVSIFATNQAKVSLTVNGQTMVTAEDRDRWTGDAVSAILMLEALDQVSCIKWVSGDILHDEDSHSFNTFAGFLYASL